MKKYILYILVGIASWGLASCNGFLDVDQTEIGAEKEYDHEKHHQKDDFFAAEPRHVKGVFFHAFFAPFRRFFRTASRGQRTGRA